MSHLFVTFVTITKVVCVLYFSRGNVFGIANMVIPVEIGAAHRWQRAGIARYENRRACKIILFAGLYLARLQPAASLELD